VKGDENGDGSNNHQNKFGKFKKGKRNGKTRRTESKVKGKGKTKNLHVINVVVQTTLPGNVKPLNIWLNCTKDP
jgi:transposase-like protein